MHSLAHYALLGSLLAGAVGALALVAVTLKYGFKRRDPSDPDVPPEVVARRQRTIRLADTVAVLCFAVAAGLGVVGLMQQTRDGVTPVVATVAEGPVVDRLHALEKRLSSAEGELQARGTVTPEWRAWEDRIARLESRLGAVEERAAVAERRAPAPAPVAPAASAASQPGPLKRAAHAKRLPAPAAPSAPPREALPATIATPEVAPPKAEPSAPLAAVAAPAPPPPPASIARGPREPARPKVEAPAPADVSIAEKIRRDWEAMKRDARRGGDEWREGWDQIRRLFKN